MTTLTLTDTVARTDALEGDGDGGLGEAAIHEPLEDIQGEVGQAGGDVGAHRQKDGVGADNATADNAALQHMQRVRSRGLTLLRPHSPSPTLSSFKY